MLVYAGTLNLFAYHALHAIQACEIALSIVVIIVEGRTACHRCYVRVTGHRYMGDLEKSLTSTTSIELAFSSWSAILFWLVIATGGPLYQNAWEEYTSRCSKMLEASGRATTSSSLETRSARAKAIVSRSAVRRTKARWQSLQPRSRK